MNRLLVASGKPESFVFPADETNTAFLEQLTRNVSTVWIFSLPLSQRDELNTLLGLEKKLSRKPTISVVNSVRFSHDVINLFVFDQL